MIAGNATHQIAVLGAIGQSAWTIDALQDTLPIDRKRISAAAGRLVARGLIQRDEVGVFSLTDAGRALLAEGGRVASGVARGWRKNPVYRDSLRQRAWKAMRLSGRFTVADIEQLAARPGEENAGESIRRFAHLLTRAGYLVELATRTPGTAPSSNGFKQWRLIRDTGEAAPQHRASKNAFVDRNTREVFACR